MLRMDDWYEKSVIFKYMRNSRSRVKFGYNENNMLFLSNYDKFY